MGLKSIIHYLNFSLVSNLFYGKMMGMLRSFSVALLGTAVLATAVFVYYASRVQGPQSLLIEPPTSTSTSTPPDNTASVIGVLTPAPKTVPEMLHMHETFDDEFNTFSRYVDASGNITCNPGGTGTWQTVYYFCSRTSAGNKEAEVYVDPGFLAYLKKEPMVQAELDSDNPFSVANGILTIQARPASSQIHAAVGPWALYTSGMITTQFSFTQTYGYFEMRAKLPAGAGLWPAFWLLPADKTWPPEVDAMEAFGDPSSINGGGRTLIHYGSHALVGKENCGAWHDVGVDITKGFHTYGVDIEPTGITYYFDGKAYATCPANSATDKPFYMVVNLAVGGDGSWPGTTNASNAWPASMEVDYVRVYQK